MSGEPAWGGKMGGWRIRGGSHEYSDILLIHDDWDSFSQEIIESISKQRVMKDHDFYPISWKKSADDIGRILQDLD